MCNCCSPSGASPGDIYYLLVPFPNIGLDIEQWAQKYDVSLVVVSGMDWDNDMTPWPAPGVPKGSPDFKGLAPQMLHRLETDVLPLVEQALGVTAPKRTLCGISLSGLFALWAWLQDDTFDNIGSISGSFWYEGFVDWLKAQKIAKTGRAYFSLGNKEGGNKGPKAFADIQQQTHEVVNILRAAGVDDTFQQTQGTHYAPPAPRIDDMLSWLTAARD